jgi:transposase-like protein
VSFYPASLERGLRSDRVLLPGIVEMYLNGVSTRKVTNILEELRGLEITVVCTGSNMLSVMPMKDSSQP